MSEKRALIVIDVQKGFDQYNVAGERNNPDCEANVARLIDAWREAGQPIVYVRHDSGEPQSVLRPGQPGNDFKDVITGTPDLLVSKSVNSAFFGTPDLDSWLKASGIKRIAICGIQTNMCCETTARMGGNMGYDVWFVLDATHTFAKEVGGLKLSAIQLAAATAVNLDGEFARVLDTTTAIGEL
ncbi:MAG: cysteine hydrolase [Phenylobacterium zucineum]|nr:MAG: cysteine hydrolase [Phenylobacterium zucineum]